MNKSFLVLFVILTGLLTGFKVKKEQILPGMIQVDKNLYIDKTEIRNIDYRVYVYWIKEYKGESSADYLNSLPDTSQKISLLFHGNNRIEEMDLNFYLMNPNFDNFPVVAISYEQAIDYCKWRADRINEYIHLQNNKNIKGKKLPDNIPQIFKLRLPTRNEWITVAKHGIDLKYKRKLDKGNTKYEIIDQSLVTGNFLENGQNMPVKVDYGYINNAGFYNIYGNVAEMSDTKGIAFGGCYGEKLSDFKIDKEYHYDSSKTWIGFRCVAEKIEN